MRTLRWAVGSLLIFAACSKGTDATGGGPAAVAGAPAGKVVELAGTVTATRDGKARPLALGDAVSGDDRVATGADGKVTIVLAHNNAKLSLGASRDTVVSASLAWGLAKQVATTNTTGDDTAAAGRHAERSSVDTEADRAPAPAAATAPAPGATPPPTAPVPTTAATTPAAKAEPLPPPSPPPPPPPSRGPSPKGGAPKGDDELGGGLGLTGTGPGGGGAGEGIGLGNIGTLGHGAGGGTGGGGSIGGAPGGGAPASPAIELRATLGKSEALRACRPGEATLIVIVECAHGACTLRAPRSDAKVTACLTKALATIKVVDTEKTTVSVPLR